MFIGRNLTYIIPIVEPFVYLGVEIDKVIKRINVIIKDIKKSGSLRHSDFNLYINGIKVRLDEYEAACDRYDEILAEAKKRQSSDV